MFGMSSFSHNRKNDVGGLTILLNWMTDRRRTATTYLAINWLRDLVGSKTFLFAAAIKGLGRHCLNLDDDSSRPRLSNSIRS